MSMFEIIAEPRTAQGKGASRRLRRAGKVPAILYGAGKEPVSLEVDHLKLQLQLQHESFYSHVLTLRFGSDAERVVLKDLQRHPYKPLILHMDLQRVSETERLTMRVPIHFLNAENCVGVKRDGGVVSHLLTDLEVTCLPRDLPEFIAIDLLDVAVGQTIHLSEVQLPAGVAAAALLHGEDPGVVSVHIPRVVEEAAPAEGAAAPAAPAADKGKS